MGMKVDDLVRQIRAEASAHDSRLTSALATVAGANGDLERLRAALAAARRAQDQLPPVTTYRRGLVARFELWVKRRLKAATRWFTWEQANFNAATVASLESAASLLGQLESELAELDGEMHEAGELPATNRETALLEARLVKLEDSLQSLINQIQTELGEHARRVDLLIDEQRVCFKQLALEISETAIVSDRGKRSLQKQLDDLTRRFDETKQTETPITGGP